jgi:DNA-binding transcriptional LysR family regulator
MPLVAETIPIYLLFPPDSQQDPKVRAFLDLAVTHLGRAGLWLGQEGE